MEENKVATDSSAPNPPEVTRLSGEQAEERTAREGRIGRARSWIVELLEYGEGDADETFFLRGPHGDEITLVELLNKFAESECSRLASRVGRLENLLRRCYQWIPLEQSKLADDVKEALGMETYRGLAGAHAEEKQ